MDRFPDPPTRPRRQPLEVGGPWTFTHRIAVKDAPIDFNPPEDVAISNPAFDFSLKGTSADGGRMDLTWTYVPKAHAVPADQAAAVLKDAEAVRDATWYSWDLTPE